MPSARKRLRRGPPPELNDELAEKLSTLSETELIRWADDVILRTPVDDLMKMAVNCFAPPREPRG